jgi:hypothetical protein
LLIYVRGEADHLVSSTARECRSLSQSLARLATKIEDTDYPLNTLGEVQGRASMLDAQIASLATLRAVLRRAEDAVQRETKAVG